MGGWEAAAGQGDQWGRSSVTDVGHVTVVPLVAGGAPPLGGEHHVLV